ncbi:Zn-dependent exopeptidase [Exidia glandulosa HHB12029]|uniref:Peptide hydrolase n=1 Tax=Exidia glandulosa HHB12029 TaxID=1314781 RepID=A0A165E983_EXIGL|nr:Zn-dependent exopeptidase [Exidia glandulosa HHB12029]
MRFTAPDASFEHFGADANLLSFLAARPRRFGPGFLDLTEASLPAIDGSSSRLPVNFAPKAQAQAAAPFPTPNSASYPELAQMFAQVSATGLTSTINSLTNFTTRYYKSTSARAPSLWIQSQFESVVGKENVALVENSFDQPNGASWLRIDNDEVVIIGAHLDSINQRGGASSRAPGADDDASGIAVILQALQILQAAGFRGARRIEAHAYAGEEGGLLGSARTASQYKAAGKQVRGMLQMDMKGTKAVITLTNDTDASPPLQAFVRAVVGAYVPEASFKTARCGYACTDHCTLHLPP